MRGRRGVEQVGDRLEHHPDIGEAGQDGAPRIDRHVRDLARLQLHVEADDAEQDDERDDGEQQVHRDARQKDDAAFPERQAAILLLELAFVQGMGILDRARLTFLIALRHRKTGRLGCLDLALAGDNLHGAVGVVLVLLLGAGDAAPLDQLVEGGHRLVIGYAAIGGDVFHVRRAATVHRRQHRLKMRAHLARLHAAYARIAAKQDGRHAELGAPLLESDIGAGHAQHEFGDAHAERS